MMIEKEFSSQSEYRTEKNRQLNKYREEHEGSVKFRNVLINVTVRCSNRERCILEPNICPGLDRETFP